MVVSNFLFDLYFFLGRNIPPTGKVAWLARGTAGCFIFLAGLSMTLRRHRLGHGANDFIMFCRRGLRLVALGLVVSVATWLAAGDQYVRFGVLHLIGSGMIVGWPLLGRPRLALAAGLLVLAAGIWTTELTVSGPWLLWLGVRYPAFRSVDYVPLVPWLGPLLLGIAAGNWLYPNGRPVFFAGGHGLHPILAALSVVGRHSLLIYFLHQPVLLGGIVLFKTVF